MMAKSEAAGITRYEPLLKAQYWQESAAGGETIVLNEAGVAVLNRRIAEKSPTVFQLENYPLQIDGQTLRRQMKTSAFLADDVYMNGAWIDQAQRQSMDSELNLDAIPASQAARYGIVVQNSNLRALPVQAGIFGSVSDANFDVLQETTLDAAEPVVVLHTSRSGGFYYVQARNYRGWIDSTRVALASRDAWLSYVKMENFLVVTARNLILSVPEGKIVCQMGSRLKLKEVQRDGYQVLLPQRGADGGLSEREKFIDKTADVHIGDLPYTRANLLTEAFKYCGAPYGWGGLKESEDCSGFIADVYKTVGVLLPRDADEQETTAGHAFDFNAMDASQRKAFIIGRLLPGDALYMDGHALLYIGAIDGEPYAIHALGSYGKAYADGRVEKIRVMQVVVSDLNLTSMSRKRHIELLRRGMAFY